MSLVETFQPSFSGVWSAPSHSRDPAWTALRDKLNVQAVVHKRMLSNVTPDANSAVPLGFIVLRGEPSQHTRSAVSDSRASPAVLSRYQELSEQLTLLGRNDEDGIPQVEPKAISTARDVVTYLKSSGLMPPEMSWLSSEALVMLWVLGQTKYALTITAGEVGYVVRSAGETIRRESDIAVDKLDVLRLS